MIAFGAVLRDVGPLFYLLLGPSQNCSDKSCVSTWCCSFGLWQVEPFFAVLLTGEYFGEGRQPCMFLVQVPAAMI